MNERRRAKREKALKKRSDQLTSAHTCETCRWWVDFTRAKAPGGECHHCAPVVSTDGEAAGETLWPWTRKDNVCGTDWAPRLEAPKEG